MMTKLKAFLIHLIISLGIFLIFFSLTRFIWYPLFYFSASGAWDAMFTVAFVDVVLGPLLTLVLYKRGKPGLKFDLSMIALFQISALVWGVWVLYSERPVLTVYYEDSFYCLSEPLAKAANANLTLLKTEGITIPQAFLAVPKTPEEARARETVMKTLPNDGVRPNLPAYVFGEQFEPITQENLSEIMENELDIARAVTSKPEYEQIWEAFRNTHKEAARTYAFFPLRCSATEHLAALERKTGVIVDSMAMPSLNAIRKKFLTPQKRRDHNELLFPK
jgi:IS1 family transposase